MDGKNSTGRRISLLNDNPAPPPARTSSNASSPPSRSSSYTDSPVGSPPTPHLVRSDSSDSTNMQTPSPMTPEFGEDSFAQFPVYPSQTGFFPSQKELPPAYAAVTQAGQMHPYAPAEPQPVYYAQPLAPEPRNASSTANPRSKKNSYPCPVAKLYNCSDHFTTSGHAARHAKKHTGKKDAVCPDCLKAFTRKDNMEQHRRTHQSGRNAAKGGDPAVKKAKQQARRPKPAPIQSSMQSLSSLSTLDPSLPLSPAGSSFGVAPAVQPADSFGDYSHRSPYPDPAAFAIAQNYSPGSSYGLDTLAIAAVAEQRKFEP